MITVIKRDHAGDEVWRYEGKVLERGPSHIVIEAIFGRPDRPMGYATFRQGDRLIETFHSDRWYNVFEIHDVDDDRIKGWYCNLTRPALITDEVIDSEDLALDVFVTPEGMVLIQDEAEYAALGLPQEERIAVMAAVEAIRRLVAARLPPFDQVVSSP
ncbi:MAG: DUF402 domain-containing protein [Anaerolineae bacterium]